jgi:histidine kinase
MSVIGIIANLTTPAAYQRHLAYMAQQLDGGDSTVGQPGQGQGLGQGLRLGQGNGRMIDFHENFRKSFNEALIIAVVAASIVALAVSFVFSRNILAPVRVMTTASQRIAEGHYDERVDLRGNDELNQLAGSFNQMAEQLEQVEAMRRRLIGDVAHELRTPLTAIRGSAEALMDGVLPASAETYSQIHAEAQRLSRLVDDLQELSRVESRAAQLNLRSANLAFLAQTVSKRLQHQFDGKQVLLTLTLPRVPVFVLADEDRIIQVITNLVGNALQYTPSGGTVSVLIEGEKEEARVSVQDTGYGIPAEHLKHIFDRFYRVDKSRSRAHGGSGIGLTIAKHLVEAHGGRIWAESAGENKGSVFIFTLPLAK